MSTAVDRQAAVAALVAPARPQARRRSKAAAASAAAGVRYNWVLRCSKAPQLEQP